MEIITLISQGFRAVGEFFGFINKKTELNNTPEMKARDEARKDNELKDKISEDVQGNKTDDIRKNISP